MSASVQAARVLLRALADLGLREVVLAPGSRSAPLAYAAAEAAAGAPGAPGLDLHVRLDERGAAFCALGLARAAAATGDLRPVAVVTTSGTAVANLHPAVLEAHHAGLPLLLLVADRPHELRGTGANQTTHQVGLLAPAEVHDVPAPTGRPDEDRDLRALAARVVAAATGARTGAPGPVHVNLAYREPLVPDGAAWPAPGPVTEVVPRGHVADPAALAAAPTVGPTAVPPAEPDGVPTVVVAGDGAGPDARRVAEANGWPLLAEPSSGARGGPNAVPAYRLLLDHPGLGGAVRRVVVLGRATLSRPVQALLGRADVETFVVARSGAGWPDAARSATQVLAEVPPLLLRGDLGRGATGPRGPWLESWQAAGRAALGAVRDVAASGPSATGPQVADVLARALGPDDVLVAGASNPVRDLDLVADWAEPPLVLANRGLAGIDGTVATASGVALALGRRVVAHVGDVTFLHDVGSLVVGPLERRPDLTVVVADDDGGSIFATLEHGTGPYAHHLERVFATPHGADLVAAARGLGVPAERVAPDGLAEALRDGERGPRVLVVPVDRTRRRDLHADLVAAVRAAVG